VYTVAVARERTITRLELKPVIVEGAEGWVEARWRRSDGSKGYAYADFRRRYADQWGISQLLIDAPTATLLAEVPLARIENAANADAEIRGWIEKGSPAFQRELQGRRGGHRRRMRLKRPGQRRLDDGFYRQVANAYADAVRHGLPPAKTLAEDADTPPGTVNRWIATARRRGYLSPAKPGKVSV
jgi:hypothetical protein